MTTLDAFVPSVSDLDFSAADEWESVPALTYDRTESLDAVLDAYIEAAEPNWDGEAAEALSADALVRACQFVLALPDGMPEPEADPSPHGTVLFQWYAAPYRRLTVSVGDTDTVAFSALLGETRRRGTDTFGGEVSDDIVRLAYQIVGWR